MDLVKLNRRFFSLADLPFYSHATFRPQATKNTMFDQPNFLFGIEKFSRSHDFPLIQESSSKISRIKLNFGPSVCGSYFITKKSHAFVIYQEVSFFDLF